MLLVGSALEMEKICDIFSQFHGKNAKVKWQEDMELGEKIFEYNNNTIFSLSSTEETLKNFFSSKGDLI